MKGLFLILVVVGFSLVNPPYELEIKDFSFTPEKISKGSSVLLAFSIYNPGPDLPANSFKMETKINGKLVSLDDEPNFYKSNTGQKYSKVPGKYHWQVGDEKELEVEIILTPKNPQIKKSVFTKVLKVS